MSVEILAGQLLLIQEEGQIALLTIHSHARENLPRPRLPDGTYPVSRVTRPVAIILQNASVRERSGRIQMGKHGALDTPMHHKQVV